MPSWRPRLSSSSIANLRPTSPLPHPPCISKGTCSKALQPFPGQHVYMNVCPRVGVRIGGSTGCPALIRNMAMLPCIHRWAYHGEGTASLDRGQRRPGLGGGRRQSSARRSHAGHLDSQVGGLLLEQLVVCPTGTHWCDKMQYCYWLVPRFDPICRVGHVDAFSKATTAHCRGEWTVHHLRPHCRAKRASTPCGRPGCGGAAGDALPRSPPHQWHASAGGPAALHKP
jgi:hypothetical protein